MIAIDIDGTLVNSQRQLTRPVVEAVRDARDAGVHVVLATARPPVNAQEVLKGLGLETLMICYNGAWVGNGEDLKTIHHWPMPVELALKSVLLARKINPQVQVRIDVADKWYTDQHQGKASGPKAPAKVGKVTELITEPVSRLTFLGERTLMSKTRQLLKQNFGSQIGIQHTDERFIQIMLKGVDKSSGVKKVAEHYGVRREQVMSIGDAPNDLPMMIWSGCAVAVANSYSEVVEVSDHQVASNNKHGVAEAIRKYVLAG